MHTKPYFYDLKNYKKAHISEGKIFRHSSIKGISKHNNGRNGDQAFKANIGDKQQFDSDFIETYEEEGALDDKSTLMWDHNGFNLHKN